MKPLSNVILICFIAGPLFAQTQKGQSFQDIQQEMLEMQRRFLQQFEQLSPGNQAFTLPEGSWDTTFTFRFDTTIDGRNAQTIYFASVNYAFAYPESATSVIGRPSTRKPLASGEGTSTTLPLCVSTKLW